MSPVCVTTEDRSLFEATVHLPKIYAPVETWPAAPEPPAGRERIRFGRAQEYTLDLAAAEAERLKCWSLVHAEYLACGYASPQADPYRYSLHDGLPDTATFLAMAGERAAGTVSVFPDSPLGLPADEIFKPELDALRRDRRTPVEIGRLAIDKAHKNDRALLITLFDILSIYSRRLRRATDLVVTVNPSHAKFYEKMLLFARIGSTRDLGSVCGAPAVLMQLDLARQRQVIRWAHEEGPRPEGGEVGRTFYGHFSNREDEARRVEWLRAGMCPPDEPFLRKYFVARRPLIPGLSPALRYFFEKCYPSYSLGSGRIAGTEQESRAEDAGGWLQEGERYEADM